MGNNNSHKITKQETSHHTPACNDYNNYLWNKGIFSMPYFVILTNNIQTDVEQSLICEINFIQTCYTKF
jgi:hypothetical protein